MKTLKHINTLTWEHNGNIKVSVEFFYKERMVANFLIDKTSIDEYDLECEERSRNKHIQKLINENEETNT